MHVCSTHKNLTIPRLPAPQKTVAQAPQRPWQKYLLAILASFKSHCSEAFNLETAVKDDKLTMKRLDNGFIYYVRHNDYPFPQRAQLQLVIRTGFLNEKHEERGIAHLLEHITQHQTENFGKGEIDKYFASKGMSWGGDSNAYTDSTSTVYKLNLPLDDPEILDKALLILSEVAQKATLSDSLIDAEREIVIDELRLQRGVSHRYKSAVNPILLEGTPYAALFDLDHEINNVKTCPADVVRNFYKRWYQPENMSVVAVGGFDTKQVSEIIEKYFGSMPSSQQSPSKHNYVTTAGKVAQFVTFTDPELTANKVEVFHRLKPVVHDGKVTHAKLKKNHIVTLGLSMLNARFSEMRSQPKPPFLNASGWKIEIIPDCPYFGLSTIGAEGELAKSYKQALLELKRVQQHGFNEIEFKRTQINCIAGLEHCISEKNKTSTSTFIEIFKGNFLNNYSAANPDKLNELRRDILTTVSLQDVNAFFANLPLENPIVISSMPQKAGTTSIEADELKQISEEVKNEEVVPYIDTTEERPLLKQLPTPGTIATINKHEKADVTEYTLSNGMRVLVKPTTFVNDKATIHAYAVKGSRSVPLKDRFAAVFAENFYDCCGMGDLDLSTFIKCLSGKNVALSSEINSYTTIMSIGSGKKDLETAFQLFYMTFADPGYNQKAFDTAVGRLEEALRNSNNHPLDLFNAAILATNTQNDPAFKPITIEGLKQIDYETCKNLHHEMFSNPADFTITIVGNVADTDIKGLIERYMASLSKISERKAQYDYPPVAFPPGITRKEIYAGKESACITCLTFPAAITDTTSENRLSSWCCELLDRRLHEVLRKQLGKTYSPSCTFGKAAIPSLNTTNPSKSQIVISCDQNNLKELEAALLSEIKSMQMGGLTEDELSDFKKTKAKDYVDFYHTNGGWLSTLIQRSLWNADIDQFDEYKQQLEDLDHAKVSNHFKKLFNLDNYSMVTLLPEGQAPKNFEA